MPKKTEMKEKSIKKMQEKREEKKRNPVAFVERDAI